MQAKGEGCYRTQPQSRGLKQAHSNRQSLAREQGDSLMPIQTTNIDAAIGYDGYDITADEVTYVIASGVSVVTATGIAVNENYRSDMIDNFGQLISSYGVGVAIYGSSINDALINEASGSISGQEAVIVNGTSAYIANYGTMTGSSMGIEEFAGSGTHVDNYGRITGNNIGVEDEGLNDIAFNHGMINSIGTGFLFSFSSGTGMLENLGTISGMTAAISSSGAGAVTIKNLGSLIGDVSLTDTGGDTFVNKGSMEGDVQLGNGANTFNGVRGTVDGMITGGSGVDIIKAGNDGETIAGGGGHDQLYGGKGADTFVFSSTMKLDIDTVHGFNVVDDTIELSGSDYAALVAGVDPKFSIAAAATSATDHLFYNTKNGELYYDPDGSGAQQAHEIANLGGGLKLTASDFLVASDFPVA